MTTIGRGSTAKIAAACDDGTVRIYDSVTGVLRLSLKPEFAIKEMAGAPDGSLLVCTHDQHPSMTLWDIQTGGLVHTFILGRGARCATVSLKGRYLACETYRKTVGFWEMASRTEYPDFLDKFEGHTPCWLAPEELIMVVNGLSVYIRNVVTKGPPVHKFEVPAGSLHSAIYSQTFDRLVIVPKPKPFRYHYQGISFTILNVKTGTPSTLLSDGRPPSIIAFSQTTRQLVCGGKDPGLTTVDISTGFRAHFDFPATATSVSTLSNGTVVANFEDSGIQLLRLDKEDGPPRQPTPPPPAMYPLDKGRIITIVPATNGRVILLETATMSQVSSIPANDRITVLCASLENKIAVHCFEEQAKGYLQMWKFSHQDPQWTELTGAPASIGNISPTCTRLLIFHHEGSGGSIHVRDVYNGRLLAWVSIGVPQPLDIIFNSEVQFYVYNNVHRETYVINTMSRTGNSPIRSITRSTKRQLEGQELGERYCLDDGCEWVIRGSQRICWVPPGYVGSVPGSRCWCWVGSLLVMCGRDGTFRKLNFLESSS